MFKKLGERVYIDKRFYQRVFALFSRYFMASIRHVAEQAGVSMTTVSQVLNERVGARISLETKMRVRNAAQELNYEPNRLARSLITGRTETIGLMVSGFRNPFFVELMEAAEKLILDRGYQTMLDPAPSHRGSFREHGRLKNWPVDGVLMWSTAHQKIGDFLGEQSKIPVVYIGGSNRGDGALTVDSDIYSGARQLAEYVVSRGYKRIAHLTPYDFNNINGIGESRTRAFAEVANDAGLRIETVIAEGEEETRAAGWKTAQILAARPAARRPQVVLCHNDIMAIGAYHGFRRAGLRVPEDIAVAGFDGIDEGNYLDTVLTTVVVPVEEMCRRALTLLFDKIDENDARFSGEIIVPTTLRKGGTV